MNCLSDPFFLLNCLAVALINRVIRCNDDQHLLSFVVATELAIKSCKCITQLIELLDRELSFEFVEEDSLMIVLIEPRVVVVVGSLIETDSTFHESFDEVSLSRISFAMQPKVALLILCSD